MGGAEMSVEGYAPNGTAVWGSSRLNKLAVTCPPGMETNRAPAHLARTASHSASLSCLGTLQARAAR